jgi:hypothetical protein
LRKKPKSELKTEEDEDLESLQEGIAALELKHEKMKYMFQE